MMCMPLNIERWLNTIMSIDKFEPMTELKFDERKHIYTLKGFELPSVTTLMNPLSDELYSAISPDVMKKPPIEEQQFMKL